jgi:hypothetical protein
MRPTPGRPKGEHMKPHYALLALVFPCTLLGSVWQINPGQSIQEAVNSALDGDTIVLSDGLYQETVVLRGKTLVIGSQYLMDGDTNHVMATIVQASPIHPDTGSCFVYTYGEGSGSLLAGLTLEDGVGTRYWDGYNYYLLGGGAYACSSHVSLRRCHVRNCTATIGGGVCALSSRRAIDTHAVLSDCIVYSCHSSYWGGGLGGLFASVLLERCLFLDDSCPGGGGGIHVMEGPVTLRGCVIRNCRGQIGGLGYIACSGEISDCIFDSNATRDCYPGPCHMGIVRSSTRVTGCLFRHAAISYPAIQMEGLVDAEPLRFWGNVVEENDATTVSGTIYAYGVGFMEIGYCLIRNNTNWRGGAIVVQTEDPRLRVHHSVIEHNLTSGLHDGSAIHLQYGTRVQVDSNRIIGNTAPAVGLEDERFHQHFENNWWGDASGPYHPTLNPEGRGDTLYQDSILFIPWLTSPPDTTMPESAVRERPEVASTWRLVAVYPNPFNNTIRLIFAGFSGSDFTITLHNLLGQQAAVLHRGPLAGGELSFTAPPTLASGVYFLCASDHLSIESRKVVLLK